MTDNSFEICMPFGEGVMKLFFSEKAKEKVTGNRGLCHPCRQGAPAACKKTEKTTMNLKREC